MTSTSGSYMLPLLVLWPAAGGALAFAIGRSDRRVLDCAVWAVTLIELAAVWFCRGLADASFTLKGVCGLGLSLKLDGFRLIYAVLTAFMWAVASIFSSEYLTHHKNCRRYHLFVLITQGAMMGVFLSADLFTTFVFFEMMSLSSYVMVAQDETPEAARAAQTYLAVTIIGGMATLLGLTLLYRELGTLALDSLSPAALKARAEDLLGPGLLMLVGFAAKAAIFPLHVWLPTAHAAAPAPSSALLSGLLTKTGVFGILMLSATLFRHDPTWALILLLPALVTMVLGAVLGVFSVNLKRTLACSSMSQLGFILTGVAMLGFLGPENDLAARGVALYMVGHSLIKLVLFLSAGVVHMNTGALDLNDVQGFGRGKPLFCFAFSMGALGLMGVPLWNGYIAKTLLHESILEHLHLLESHGSAGVVPAFLNALGLTEPQFFGLVEWTFLISGGLTVAYVLKLFVALFAARPQPRIVAVAKKRYMNPVSAAALTLPALLLPLLGALPHRLTDSVGIMAAPFMGGPVEHRAVHYFSPEALAGAVIPLVIGTAVYALLIRRLLMRRAPGGRYRFLNRWPDGLDLEGAIYRPLLLRVLPLLGGAFATAMDRAASALLTLPLRVGRLAAPAVNRAAEAFLNGLPRIGFPAARALDALASALPLSALERAEDGCRARPRGEADPWKPWTEPPPDSRGLPMACALAAFAILLAIFMASRS